MKKTITNHALKLHLEACSLFWYASDNYIRMAYNGVGNQALPEEIRALLTYLTRFFGDLPFMIHDFEFTHMKKTKKNFHLANKHLKNNLKKILDNKLPKEQKIKWYEFWNWHKFKRRKKRLFYLSQIRIIYFACEMFGWGAFKTAEVNYD